MNKYAKLLTLGLTVFCAQGAAYAAVAQSEAAKLGGELTPTGADPKANQDGSIPAWTGSQAKAPSGFQKGAKPIDPFAGEKPLFSINASNAAQYQAKLSPGQKELLKLHQGYRMDVYPSHRSCPLPASVAAQTRKNATDAKLAADGWGLAQVQGGGFPFPIPQNGAEAIWNFKLRYQGESMHNSYVGMLPPKGASGKNLGVVQQFYDDILFPLGKPDADLTSSNGMELYFSSFTTAPAAVAGEGTLARYYIAKPNDLWLYFASQRRVRRAPTYQYDAPVLQSDNLLAVDQVWMYNGPVDRYDFKLVGKQELIVPYNNVPLYDHTVAAQDVHDPLFMARDKVRYESHRVWVVEANVKPGMRHSFPKRTFYLDEDSWLIVAEDLYDAQGKIWRSMEAYTVVNWDLGACVQAGYASYDLQVGRYLSDRVVAGSGKAPVYGVSLNTSDFSVESFRSNAGR
jgi:hypothetical protein